MRRVISRDAIARQLETVRGTAVVLTVCALTLVFCMWAAFEIGKRGAGLVEALDTSRSQPSGQARSQRGALTGAGAQANPSEAAGAPAAGRPSIDAVREEPVTRPQRRPRSRNVGRVKLPRSRSRGRGERRDHLHSPTLPRAAPLDRLRTRLRDFLRRAPTDGDGQYQFKLPSERKRADQPARDCFVFGCDRDGGYDVFGRR